MPSPDKVSSASANSVVPASDYWAVLNRARAAEAVAADAWQRHHVAFVVGVVAIISAVLGHVL